MSQLCEVSVIGLGAMGWGAAMSLIREGFNVHGVDIRPEVLEKFSAHKGKPCPTPAEAAKRASVVMIFVVNDQQAEQVLFGEDGAVTSAEPETLFINSSTMPPSASVRIGDRLAAAGMRVLDAPVAGGAARAERGEMTVMVSGSSDALNLAEPLFEAISAKVFRLGAEVGRASRIKMINQLLSDVHIAVTAEAMTLASKIGVNLETMYEVITQSTGNSWMFEDRGAHIVNGDYAPRSAIDIIVKDLGIVSSEAEAAGCEARLSNAALQLFKEARDAGFGREDGSAVAKLLGKKSGAELPGITDPSV
ncbi:MAG: NAD(P)-dependent oxidoreductase [Gammaproteobacteria bacterium]